MLVLNWFVMEILLGSSKFYFMVVISKNNNNKVFYIYIYIYIYIVGSNFCLKTKCCTCSLFWLRVPHWKDTFPLLTSGTLTPLAHAL